MGVRKSIWFEMFGIGISMLRCVHLACYVFKYSGCGIKRMVNVSEMKGGMECLFPAPILCHSDFLGAPDHRDAAWSTVTRSTPRGASPNLWISTIEGVGAPIKK